MRRLRRMLLTFIVVAIGVAAAYVYVQNEEKKQNQIDGEDIVNVVEPVTVTGKILVWTGPGNAPGQHDPAEPGQFITISGEGKRDLLQAAPRGTTRVLPCSERAATPNNQNFAFYAGHDSGTLFLFDGDGKLHKVDEVGALTCLGLGTFQYADDGSRFGYIDYGANQATEENTPVGTLVIRGTRNREEIGRFENAIAFDLAADSLAYAGFFTGNTQAGVFTQTGSGGATNVVTLTADENCEYRAGALEIVNDDMLLVLLGQSCEGGSRWSMHSVSISGHRSTLIHSGLAGGKYAGHVRINTLFVAPDGDTAYFTVPNGLATDRADLYAASLTSGDDPERLIEYVFMPKFDSQAPHNPTRDAWPIVSSDRRFLAIASKNANNEASVHIVDITSSDPAVISFSAGNAGDSVSSLAFSLDGSRLVFVAGGNNRTNNWLYIVEMASLIEERLTQGRYAPGLVVAPDASAAVTGSWEFVDEPVSDTLINLIRVNFNDLTTDVLRTGGDVTATQIANRRFSYPLQWR